jgi:hypothetical protein
VENPDFAGLLIMTADVYRRQTEAAPPGELPAEVDPYGQRQKKDPYGQPTRDEQFSHTLPCRLKKPSGGERNEERARDLVDVTAGLFLDLGADLNETDVVDVKGPGGEVIVQRAEVTHVETVFDGIGAHHLEADLSSQRQSR